jgi:Ni,Fe-hydrogenase I large subunit
VRLTRDDKIKEYVIVAPTEWNFHPAGPFVGALLGAALSPWEAQRLIAQLAALFDPCVPFRVAMKEAANA